MVDGDNIDEVQILLPEDKIQVTVNLHTSFILELSIFFELGRYTYRSRTYLLLSVIYHNGPDGAVFQKSSFG